MSLEAYYVPAVWYERIDIGSSRMGIPGFIIN